MAGRAINLTPDEHTGRRLGRYEVLCRLCSGGMAELFLALQRGAVGFVKPVVVKRILPDIRGDQQAIADFMDEARITASLQHPGIAQVFDLDVEEGELFLVMEFVEGATLVEVAEACQEAGEPIPVGFALEAARQVAIALHHAHTFSDAAGRARPLVHRDVAEKNVMVTFDGTVKLLDFGIARAIDRLDRTATGIVKGTVGYMAPEHVRGEPIDARADLFSLGVVLHECLTGRRLFYGKDAREEMRAVLQKEAPPPSRLNPEVGPAIDAVVRKALKRRRSERYDSGLEMALAIERAAKGRLFGPADMGALMRRLFAERRKEVQRLLGSAVDELDGPPPSSRGAVLVERARGVARRGRPQAGNVGGNVAAVGSAAPRGKPRSRDEGRTPWGGERGRPTEQTARTEPWRGAPHEEDDEATLPLRKSNPPGTPQKRPEGGSDQGIFNMVLQLGAGLLLILVLAGVILWLKG